MKLGIVGRLFPAAFGKVVYDYTAKTLPDLDIREFNFQLNRVVMWGGGNPDDRMDRTDEQKEFSIE